MRDHEDIPDILGRYPL